MSGDRWQRIEELFQRAADLPLAERSRFLQTACAGDEELRREVESLLAHDRSRDDGLAAAISQAASDLPEGLLTNEATNTEPEPKDPPDTQVHPGIYQTRIGPYRLLQKIGEGGMGEVWLAEQREPVRRRVALKVVKAGMNTREVMARFESERQALALMDHPAIAKVFDAGSTPQGAPYFVMEYVAGVPITIYCDKHRLTTRERLELFCHVCEGVQHAHHKAIIHRDLKPSNILVTEVDGRAAPKIIDFGVAKALTQKLTADTVFTRVGAIIGTLKYMSPEQALSAGEDIDTRTDVYSLGIILYELLAGAPPLDPRKMTFEEFLRRLREEEPPKPSTNIRTQAPDTSLELARKRQTEPLSLARQVRGDLDWIVLRALEKDRSRRYGSPSDLATDIGRYLRNEAVLAVPSSVVYRARKFIRRHRATSAAAALVTFSVITGMGATLWEAHVARQERDRADQQAAVAQAVNDFLQNDLLAQASAANQSGPNTKPDPDLKVRTALDRAAARIAGKFGRQPDVEAAIRDTIGETYMDLGLNSGARTQLARALELHRRTLGAENPKTLRTIANLARTDFLLGKSSEAEMLFSEALEIQRRRLGPEHPDTLHSMAGLAPIYQAEGKYAQAEALSRQALEIQRRVLGPEHPRTLGSMNNLAYLYSEEGKYAQAEALDAQTLETLRRVLGPEHPATLTSMYNLASAYRAQGKYTQAEELFRQNLEIRRRVLGSEHLDTLFSMTDLARVYRDEGKYTQAEVLGREALEIERRVLGPEHPMTLYPMSNLAAAYSCQARYAQAEALYRQALDISRRVLGPEHPNTLALLSDLAYMHQRQGKYALVESYTTQALAGRRRALGPENPDTMSSVGDLALAYLSDRKFDESEPLAREALEFHRKNHPDDWQRFRAETLLAASLAGQKKYAEAEPLLLEGYQGMVTRKERIPVPDWYHLDRAREWIVQLYQAWGKPDKAVEWSKK